MMAETLIQSCVHRVTKLETSLEVPDVMNKDKEPKVALLKGRSVLRGSQAQSLGLSPLGAP